MKRFFRLVPVPFLFVLNSYSQIVINPDTAMIGGHRVVHDRQGRLLSWYNPETPGAGYVHVMKLASEFIKSGTPVDSGTGLSIYYISCCFQGPHMANADDFRNGKTWEHWPNNPSCVFAGLVRSLALGYRVYSGDTAYIKIIGDMLDFQLAHGTTPVDWPWPSVPYASSDPGDTLYAGASHWEADGMRGDGLHGIEPDKVGELGLGYLMFYEITGRTRYLKAALSCASALASHVRDVRPGQGNFIPSAAEKSPWPFRVNARTGMVISEYSSNVIEPIHLFDEVIRISDRIGLPENKADSLRKARDIAWEWLFSINGPMKTYIWNGYFEDVPNDPGRDNRLQITPMETARYLLGNPSLDPALDRDIPALLHWVAATFATSGMDAIKEQTWCYEPMGSHTARYASVCALWYARSGDPFYKDEASRYFNLASYMTDENGVVRVGPNWPGSWFSDGYGDYIRHFYEGLGAIPEWSPAGENHLLNSTSVIQSIDYKKEKIDYRTFDKSSGESLSLFQVPKAVTSGGKKLSVGNIGKEAWSFRKLSNGNYLVRVSHSVDSHIEIFF